MESDGQEYNLVFSNGMFDFLMVKYLGKNPV